jgi:hypothetical protein
MVLSYRSFVDTKQQQGAYRLRVEAPGFATALTLQDIKIFPPLVNQAASPVGSSELLAACLGFIASILCILAIHSVLELFQHGLISILLPLLRTPGLVLHTLF